MNERTLWRIAAIAGVAVVALAVAFGMIAGLKACAPPQGLDPIIAFELARSPAQALALLTGPVCVGAQHGALWLDALGFIPAYAIFYGAGAAAAGGRFAKVAVAATVAAALFDQVEGVELFRILADPASAAPYALLVPAVRAKFALLGLVALLIGGRLVQRRGWEALPGALIALSGGVTIVSVADDARAAIMMKAITLGLLALLARAAIRAFRRAS
ncbi:MAG: hypothetical protein H0X36_13890 [Sphingomonadaceae bacterium]|nr:hypothetical protein [Sphingomonadaceae bacterium]